MPGTQPQPQTQLVSRPMWTRRGYWIGIFIILIVAAVPRLMSYDYGLPYLENIDEAQLYFFAQNQRGLYFDPDLGAGYPPGVVKIYELSEIVMESLGQPGTTPTVQLVRFLAVVANLITLILIAVAANYLAGPVAGLVAASTWALSPTIVEETVDAISESFAHPLMVLAVLLAAVALSNRRRWYLGLVSIGLGMLLFLLEYRFMLATIPGLVALGGLCLRDRRLSLRTGLVLLAVTLAGGALGLFVVQHLAPGRQRIVLNVLTNYLWDGQTVLKYIGAVIVPLNLIPVLIFWAGGGLAYWLARRQSRPTVQLLALFPFVLMTILLPWVISAVRLYGNETTFILLRHILPTTALACVVLGAAVAQIWFALPQQTIIRAGFLLLTGAVLIGPQVQPMMALVQDREVQSWQVPIRQWADINLQPGTVIVYNVHRNTFNPYWGGIQGRKWFDWWPTEAILEHPLDEWIQPRGMSYALLPIPQYRQLQQTAEGQALLDRMLPLRDFVHPPTRREAEGIFFRLWRMQHETSIGFGSHITLTGFDQSTETIRPGETVDFTFYWNAPTTPEDNYSLFLHLVPDETYTVLAQADGAPAVPERPTLTWDEPSETLISPTFTLTAPPDLPPGHYRVMMGLYNFQTGVRLPVSAKDGTSGDAYRLAEFDVEGQGNRIKIHREG